MAIGAKLGLAPYQRNLQRAVRGRAGGKGFTPFEYPTAPPQGTYDPMLDAQLRQAQRGYFDLQQDTEVGGERRSSAYGTNVTEAQQNEQRSLADELRARAREGENYATDTSLRKRRYGQLGESQTGQAVASGNTRGGGLAAALAARTENQGIEQSAVDVAHARYGEDSAQREARIHQDYEAPDTGLLAKLQRDYQYGGDDAATALARAGRELGFYGQDIGEAKFGQAAQAGYVPPTKPSNEFSDARGPYRLIKRGNVAYRLRPNGKLERR